MAYIIVFLLFYMWNLIYFQSIIYFFPLCVLFLKKPTLLLRLASRLRARPMRLACALRL
ncbi:hypothetical protein Hanom_Chr06g00567211 [Helianthus anomalus]